MSMKWWRFLSLIFFLFFSVVGISQEKNSASLEKSVERIILKNGMRFLVLRDSEVPIFSAHLTVEVGGIDEGEGQSGLAHLLEHMAFKGSHEIDKDELSRIYEENGAQGLNATTSKDFTNYFVDLPKNRLKLWAELESDRFLDPVMREFELEKNVVIQERRQRVDNNPDGLLYERFLAEAFPDHPYGIPTIGSVSDIQRLSAEELEAFFKKFYTPKHIVGALVGDLPANDELKPLLEATFGRLERPDVDRGPFPPFKRDRETVFKLKLNASPALMVGYPKPTVPSRDDIAFDVFNVLFCEGESSRLSKRLIFEEKLASEVDCDSGVPGSRLDHLFMISAKPLPGVSLDALLAALDREIAWAKEKRFERREIEKARHGLESQMVWMMKSPSGLASALPYYEALTGDWKYILHFSKTVREINAGEIRKLVATYFDANQRVVGFLNHE